MNSLKKKHLINKERLSPRYYFQSILQEAVSLSLLADSEIDSIQLQTMNLLAKQTGHFTGGESSSVMTETAQGILQSIAYTIGIYLKSLPDTDTALAALKQTPLSQLHRQGKKLIEEQFAQAKQLLCAVQDDSIPTDNCAYNDTIQNGIPVFFSAYDIKFAAHDTPASIDYPLSSDRPELAGIEYVYNYLQKLYLENQFCKRFPANDIHGLLRGYDAHYQDLLVNIFGLVLTNALGSILADKNIVLLNLEPSDRLYLQQKLSGLAADDLAGALQDASARLCRKTDISDMLLPKHMAACIPDLAMRLKNALEKNRLESIFISPKEESPKPPIQFADGNKLDDELFRSITDEIRTCRYGSDKTAIINREIHSITDLVDVLEGSCLFNGEFLELFRSIGDMELALLLKRLPTHVIDADLHISANEKEWHHQLDCYINGLEPARQERIRGLAEKIQSS